MGLFEQFIYVFAVILYNILYKFDTVKCRHSCPVGFYGQNCTNRCSCDPYGSSCSPIDGSCLCKSGYTGQYCEQGKHNV
jgi:hypothetical protein